MTPEEIIEGAIRELDKNGWCQKEYTDPLTGAHCALGALAVAQGHEGCYNPFEREYNDEWDVLREAGNRVGRKLLDVTGAELPSFLEDNEVFAAIPAINDQSSTTEETIKLAMKRALHDDAE